MLTSWPDRQWGNLLILYAVWRDPIMGGWLNKRMLRDIFDKTIAFFELLAQGSSSLVLDMNILKGIRTELN